MNITDKPQLNEHQQAAVEASEPRVLVRAGAGSGKTRVLTERIAYLIEDRQASPHEIMAFTFTRKAAQEMKERLLVRVGSAAHKIDIGTFHAVGLDFIQRHAEMIGFRQAVTVYGEWETNHLIERAAEALGYRTGKKWKTPKKLIVDTFKSCDERGEEPERLHPLRPLFDSFMTTCRSNNAMHFGAILVHFRDLIQCIKNLYPIQYVLTDEAQDNDELQWEILELLQEQFGAELFCVGDPDQSIYEFRGAVPQYLIEHQDDFAVYDLPENYRSFRPIVEAANSLIGHNSDRIGSPMSCARAGGDSSASFVLENFDSAVVVEYLKARKLEPSRTAILARNHFLLMKLANIMDEQGIHYHYIGKKSSITRTEEFQRFHAYMKLLVNPYDDFSFMLASEALGVSVEQLRALRLESTQTGDGAFSIWSRQEFSSPPKWVEFFNTAHKDSWSVYRIAGFIQDNGGFEDDKVWRFVMEWFEANPTESLEEYLYWVSTYDIHDELADDSSQDCYQLATIHGAKGLEWPNVIIAGVNEGLLPSSQAIRCGDIEGERRLMYVAMTRAEEKLILTIRPEETVNARGQVNVNPVSRFVEEAGL